MTKSIFAILALVLTAGCSETNVYESDNTGDAGSSSGGSGGSGGSDTGTSNTGNSSTGGSGSTGTGAGTGTDGGTGGGTSVDDLVPETCLEAGKRISGLDNHPACGTVIDKNGNPLSCSTECSSGECGGAFWDPTLAGTPVADALAAKLGGRLMNRFATGSTGAYPNVCGEGCVDLMSVYETGICPDGKTPIMCSWTTTTTPAKGVNCTPRSDTTNVWCCDSESYAAVSYSEVVE